MTTSLTPYRGFRFPAEVIEHATSVEKRRKSLRRRARDGLHRVLGAVDALVAADGAQSVTTFRDAQNPPALVEAAIACRAYERLEARGHLDAMLARYGTLRQYLPAFLALPFQAAAGSETLLRAVEGLRALDAGTRNQLTTPSPPSCLRHPASGRYPRQG